MNWIRKTIRHLAGTSSNSVSSANIERDAARPGSNTSEWKLTLWGHAVAVLLWALALIWPDNLGTLPTEDIRQLLLALGAFIFAGGQIAYTTARAKVKAAALTRDATREVAAIQARMAEAAAGGGPIGTPLSHAKVPRKP